jgi:hypothetical protein
MNEAEDNFKDALEIRRELAKTDPAIYRPDVAATLYNLALLHISTNEFGRAKADVEEALPIMEALWETNHEQAGDMLGRSLLVDAFSISKLEPTPSEQCSLAHRAQDVAYDPEVKSTAADQAKSYCAVK